MIGPRSRRSWLGLAIALGWALGSAGACFDAPMPAVQFSCDPDDAPECPSGYTCEADGCCHRDGSDVDEHLGECQLGGAPLSGSGTATVPTTEASSGDASTTSPDGTGSGTGTGSGSGNATETAGSTDAGASSGSSGGTAGSTG